MFVGAAMVLALAGTAVVALALARHDFDEQGAARATMGRAAARSAIESRREVVVGKVDTAAAALAGVPDDADPPAVARALADARRSVGLDVLVLAGPDGALLASSRSDPLLASGGDAPADRSLLSGGGRGRAVLAEAAVRAGDGTVRAVAHGGDWVDDALLAEVAEPLGVGLAVVDGERVLASSAGAVVDQPEGAFASSGPLDGGVELVATVPESKVGGLSEDVTRAVVGTAVLGLLLTAVAAALAARPYRVALRRLNAAARAAAVGEAAARVPVRGPDEVRDLARALNALTARLSTQVDEGEQEREDLRQALARMSDAFAITHDLPAIVEILTESAVRATGARSAMFFSLNTARGRLDVRSTHGPDLPRGPVPLGEGLVGTAAAEGRTVVWPGRVAPSPAEPVTDGPAVALPLRSGGRILGVLAVCGAGQAAFGDEEVDTLELLVRQAASAVDNVLLHEEVKRQSITDGLTGVWNRRQFEMRSAEEVRSAARFHDPFGVVMVDVDRFKFVNDTYGHQVGDAVLIEMARRLTAAVREIDMVARYGGEEFCLLLPRADLAETAKVADRVWDAVRSEVFVVDGLRLPITVSAGVACHPDHGSTVRELVAAADLALYRAKQAGRNRVERATPVADAPPPSPPSPSDAPPPAAEPAPMPSPPTDPTPPAPGTVTEATT